MALIDKITEDVIKVPLESTGKNDVIAELLDVLAQAGKVKDTDTAYAALLERESRGSTGLEKGIAVPHAKTDAVEGLTVAIGLAPEGIDFQALDGQPSKIFFLILAAPDQSGPHIEALSEIARMSRSDAFMRTLLSSHSPKEVIELIQE
jgi:fructose-specific phosphotransferase system IIA component